MKRVPLIFQHDGMQCGVACLAMVCRRYGRDYSLDFLGKFCFATADGTVIATDIIDDTDPATPTVTLPAPIIPGDYSITITTESGAIYSGEFYI